MRPAATIPWVLNQKLLSGQAYRLGDDVEVRLVEATAGALRFEMLTTGKHGPLVPNTRGAGPKRFGWGRRR